MNQNRPLSPHLQVYKPQVTSILSIFHRMTGVALSVGLVLLVGWIFSLSLGENIFKYYSYFLGSWLGLLIMFSFTFALTYHFCNGVRHLFWDAGYGYEISTVYKSGLAVVIISLLLTCSIWYFIMVNNA